MGYTTRSGVDLIALGASGISELEDTYAQSVRSVEEWQERVENDRLATMRGWRLSEDDKRRKWLIQALMCQSEVSEHAYADRFGEALLTRIPDLHGRLSPFVEDGLLERGSDRYRVTALGRLFLRVIAMSFDAHLPDAKPGRPMFSRTI